MSPTEARQFLELRKPWKEFLKARLESRKFDYALKCLAQTLKKKELKALSTRGAEMGDLVHWIDSQIAAAETLIDQAMK